MSDTLDDSGVPDQELLAAELVLGVLAGSERAAALRLLERDSHFAALVADWEE
jgi:anti-sigma-K factor RskA